jgi:hypothetical protein
MPAFKLKEEFFNEVLKDLSEALLLYPYDNKTGKDKSDLIRGQILGLKQAMSLHTAIENYEKNREEFKKLQEKMAANKGAN